MKNKYTFLAVSLLGVFILAGCDQLPFFKKTGDDKVITKGIENFEVCKDKSCVSGETALNDIYPRMTSINNVGIYPNVGLFSLVKSIRYNDGKDLYAIFLTQLNPVSQGEISTCHACGAILGVAVYQYHNGWKLFARSNTVAELGSWGSIPGSGSWGVQFFSGGPENFIMGLEDGYLAQGYSVGGLQLIGVSPNGVNQFQSPMRYLGSIATSASDCGTGNEKGNDWEGKVSMDWQRYPPSVTVKKDYKKNCTKEIDHSKSSSVTYVFDGKAYKEK